MLFVCMCIRAYVCACARVCACTCLCECACINVCVCVCVRDGTILNSIVKGQYSTGQYYYQQNIVLNDNIR